MDSSGKLALKDVRELQDVRWKWPDKEETYARGWEAKVEVDGKVYQFQHAVGTRKVYGATRPRSTTWIERRPVAEGVGADDFERSRGLVTLLSSRTRSRRCLTDLKDVSEVYEEMPIVWYQDEVKAKGSYRALAVKIREDDLESWAQHALFRYESVTSEDVRVSLRDPAFVRDLFDDRFRPLLQDEEGNRDWVQNYKGVLDRVQKAGPAGLADLELQRMLWDGRKGIAGLGQGEFPYLHSKPGFQEFAAIAARLVQARLPEDRAARVEALKEIHDKLLEEATRCFPGRNQPYGKVLRYLAAVFPKDVCCVVVSRLLNPVVKALTGGDPPAHPIATHAAIYASLDRALGPVDDDTLRITERGVFPMWLANLIMSGGDEVPFPESEDLPEEDAVPSVAEGAVSDTRWSRPSADEILESFAALRLHFARDLVALFHVALHSHPRKHFVLLSGLSGTGKTQLALAYADIYNGIEPGGENPYRLLVPVQPDWTDPTGILGYVNPLREKVSYVRTSCLRFLQNAGKNPGRPYFLVLDEMNLARPEHYFAPFLSAMETGHPLVVHAEAGDVDLVPGAIQWPSNLYIVGTVNMDETTHGFSDKVLDRAFTLELWDVDLGAFRRKFAGSLDLWPAGLLDFAFEAFEKLHEVLVPLRMPMGYRTLEEILLFLRENEAGEAALLDRVAALDRCLAMKLLPRIRGEDTAALREGLANLRKVCGDLGLKGCGTRLGSMAEDLVARGTVRFWT